MTSQSSRKASKKCSLIKEELSSRLKSSSDFKKFVKDKIDALQIIADDADAREEAMREEFSSLIETVKRNEIHIVEREVAEIKGGMVKEIDVLRSNVYD